MNWDLILTVVGLFITLVVFAPFFIAYALAYHKAKMSAELEAIKKHGQMFHPSNDDINWADIFEGEK
jgi:uncharacterized membrane protein YbaN (DUF454 family)